MPQRAVLFASVVIHAAALTTILVAQLLATGPLPIPHQPMMFDLSPGFVRIETVLVPKHAKGPSSREVGSSIALAPIEAPPSIIGETEHESTVTSIAAEAGDGVAVGVGEPVPGTVIEQLAPPPAPVQDTPIHLHAGIVPPRKIVNVDPRYPTLAQASRVQGVVILEAIIDTNGNATSVRVLRSIPLLDQAAIDAVRLWKFSPAQLNGRAVPVILTVTVSFKLDR